jgi:hypothetical protein
MRPRIRQRRRSLLEPFLVASVFLVALALVVSSLLSPWEDEPGRSNDAPEAL